MHHALARLSRHARHAGSSARALSIDASGMQYRDLDTMFSFTGDEQRTLLRMSSALKARLRGPDSKPYLPLVRRPQRQHSRARQHVVDSRARACARAEPYR